MYFYKEVACCEFVRKVVERFCSQNFVNPVPKIRCFIPSSLDSASFKNETSIYGAANGNEIVVDVSQTPRKVVEVVVHELTHVVQCRQGGVQSGVKRELQAYEFGKAACLEGFADLIAQQENLESRMATFRVSLRG